MSGLNRVVVESDDSIFRLAVLCEGCSSELAVRAAADEKKCLIRAYGGSGWCEICIHETKVMVGEEF